MINKILIIACLFSLNLQAQQEDEVNDDLSFKSIENGLDRPKTILKLALLSQLDFNSPSLQFGLEIKANDWLGIHQELGYVNNWLNPIYTLIDHRVSQREKIKNGFKYLFETRFYPFNKNKAFAGRMFFAPALDFRYVDIQRKEWVRINNAYLQKIKYNVQRLEYGFNFKFGITTKVKKLMPIEMVIGLGVRYISLSNTLPENIEIQGQNNSFVGRPPVEGSTWMPSAYMGMLLHLPTKKKHKTI